MGGGAPGPLNHIDMRYIVQDIQSRPFNHVCCRGVAARAESVYLMYSNEWKLDWKGTHPNQNHPVLHGSPFSMKIFTDHQKPTGSLQINIPTNTASTAS